MDLILLENKNINIQAIKKVEEFLPKIQKQTRAFDRNNSQTTLSMMSLIMLNGHSPMRILRQIAAESEKRLMALNEAQVSLAKSEAEIIRLEAIVNKTAVEEATLRMVSFESELTKNKVNGSIKDLAVLADAYDNVKIKNKIDTWDELDFEKAEKKHHIRRGFEMLYKNLIQYGRPQEATMEYMLEYGVLPQVAVHVTNTFVKQMEQVIIKGIETNQLPHANVLEDWLDKVSDDFLSSADLTSERIFGKKDFTNKDYMLKIKGDKNVSKI